MPGWKLAQKQADRREFVRASPATDAAKVNQAASCRRGELMGFDARRLEGLGHGGGADATIKACRPHHRSAFAHQGIDTFVMAFNHLAEPTSKLAEQVTAAEKAAT